MAIMIGHTARTPSVFAITSWCIHRSMIGVHFMPRHSVSFFSLAFSQRWGSSFQAEYSPLVMYTVLVAVTINLIIRLPPFALRTDRICELSLCHLILHCSRR